MIPNPNDGDRPSRLQLDRLVTGELEESEAHAVRAHLASDPKARAHVDAVEAARGEVAAFDFAALRDRAGAPDEGDAGPPAPVPANNNRAFLVALPALLMAAIALILVLPVIGSDTVDPDYVGVRGSADLQLFHLMPDGLTRYDNRALGEGDVLGFKVDPAAHDGVVVLYLDAAGQVTVVYPESGDAPQPLAGEGVVALPGSVVLDGSPGPELFVAVFDTPVSEARAAAERAWQSGGATGVAEWARAHDVDSAVVNKR